MTRAVHARGRRGGNALIEAPLVTLLIVVLMVGMVEIAKVTLTYYNLRKAVYSIARYVSVQSGVNYCDPGDPTITAAVFFGLTGTTDNSAQAQIPNLTPDMITVSAERLDPVANTLTPCACSVSGCDISAGGGYPDFIVVSIPNGYSVTPHLPFITVDPISLRPQVKVPFGGS